MGTIFGQHSDQLLKKAELMFLIKLAKYASCERKSVSWIETVNSVGLTYYFTVGADLLG